MTEYHEGDWHIDIIRNVLQQYVDPIYIEIGVRTATSFNAALPLAKEAHGVDIDEGAYSHMRGGTFYHMDSDRFFSQYDGDCAHVIFIDGNHSYEQVKIDYKNALELIRTDGTIVLHDTWPVVKENAVPGVCDGVWRLAADLEIEPSCNAYTFRKFPGVTVVNFLLSRWSL